MAEDQIDKLLIALGYDTTQLDSGAREAISKTNALNRQFASQGDEMARLSEVSGQKAGKNFAKAYGKEMMFLRAVLRKYFGEFGDLAGEGLGLMSKFGKTKFAAAALPTVGGSAAGEIAGHAGGGALSTMFASGTGAAGAMKVAKVMEKAFAAQAKDFETALGKEGRKLTSPAFLNAAMRTPRGQINPITLPLWAQAGASVFDKAGPAGTARQGEFGFAGGIRSGDKGHTPLSWMFGNKAAGQPGFLSRLFSAPNITGQMHMGNIAQMTGGGFSNIASGARGLMGMGPALPGGAVAGGILGPLLGLAATMKIFASSSKGYEERKARAVEMGGKGDLIKEINAIKDPTERTKRILEEFGKDGQKIFREMTVEVGKFNKEFAKEEELRRWGATANATWSGVKEFFGSVGGWAKNAGASVMNFFASLSGNAVSKELSDAIIEGEQRIETMTRNLDKKRAEKVMESEYDKKIADKEIESQRASMTDTEKLASYKLELEVLKEGIKISTDQKKDKEDTLKLQMAQYEVQKEYNALQKKIADDEKKLKEDLKEATEEWKKAVDNNEDNNSKMTESNKRMEDLVAQLKDAKTTDEQRLEIIKKLTEEEKTQTSLLKEQDSLKKRIKDKEQDIANANDKMGDRFKTNVSDLAENKGTDPDEVYRQTLRKYSWMPRRVNYNNKGEMSIRKAQQIEAEEAFVKQAEALGYGDNPRVQKAKDIAARLRKEISGLTSEERDPMKAAADSMKKMEEELKVLKELAVGEGLPVRPKNGK